MRANGTPFCDGALLATDYITKDTGAMYLFCFCFILFKVRLITNVF